MTTDLFGGIVAKAIGRFPLDHAVDEIGRLNRPIVWNFMFFYLDLSSQDIIPYFFSTATVIWSLSEHELIDYNTEGKVINRECMILSAHYFWSCIKRRIYPYSLECHSYQKNSQLS